MAITYDCLATTTLGANAASVTISSIPSTYTDLRIIASIYNDASGSLLMRANGSSSVVYSNGGLVMTENGFINTLFAVSSATQINEVGNVQTTRPTGIIIDIFNYSSGSGGGSYYNGLIQSIWYNPSTGVFSWGYRNFGIGLTSSAINSLTFFTNGNNLLTDSKISIYGIKAA